MYNSRLKEERIYSCYYLETCYTAVLAYAHGLARTLSVSRPSFMEFVEQGLTTYHLYSDECQAEQQQPVVIVRHSLNA
jgi:hypothetical protein